MKVYLAAPFFNPEQIALVEKIEIALRSIDGVALYSPREDGVLGEMSSEDKRKATANIFRLNCENIEEADMVVAVIDGRDTGVVWELGYAYAQSNLSGFPDIVTYTSQDYGLNVMIQECVDAHVRSIAELVNVVKNKNYDKYRNFNENVT
jgi:nucleoside 2-deoxyribosyltransferase